MIIINATSKLQSLMTSQGKLIQIQPGGISETMIASKNLIAGAIKLGTPKEIGIVLGGSYELEIAKDITASVPYIYTDLNEAKAKLIDPSIDYTTKRQGGTEVILRQDILNKQAEIKSLKETINNLNLELEKVKSDQSMSKLNDIISEKTQRVDTLEKRIKELETQLKTANENESKSRSELGMKSIELNQSNSNLEALRKEHANTCSQLAQYKSELEKLPSTDKIIEYQKAAAELNDYKDSTEKELSTLKLELKNRPTVDEFAEVKSERDAIKAENDNLKIDLKRSESTISDLKDALKEATTTIDLMKTEFNTACEKFGITKDDNGNWVKIEE